MKRLVAAMALAVLVAGPALAQAQAEQQQDIERVAAEQQLEQRIQKFVDMGIEREAATFLAVLSEAGMDPAQIMMFFMMAEHGGEDAAGLMLLMNAMKQQGPTQPVVVQQDMGGPQALIVDDGALYVIDLEAMEVTGRVDYRRSRGMDPDAIWSLLAPMMAGGREAGGPQARNCRERLRVLAGAFWKYAQDHDGTLPGENWVEAITPYLETPDLLRCPARPEQQVGYAMNEKLVGAVIEELEEPEETILLFDTWLDDPAPVGGPEAVPDAGIHDEGVNAVYLNGTVEWLPVAEAREVLQLR